MKIEGIFAPMIVPFGEGGSEPDLAAYERNVKKWAETGMKGLLALGSNSETAFLTEKEKLEIIRITVRNANGKTIMVGTGMETPRATIDFTNRAAALGAQCALVLPPNFFDSLMDDRTLIDFYTTVADSSDIPILLYNVPQFTHVVISPEAVRVLSEHPNIIGLKDSSGNIPGLTAFLKAAEGRDFVCMVGAATALFPALCLGAAGGILALANCCPDECVEIYDLFREGRFEESRKKFFRMFPVGACVEGPLAVAALKEACTQLGFEGGHPGRPFQELLPDQRGQVISVLNDAGLIRG